MPQAANCPWKMTGSVIVNELLLGGGSVKIAPVMDIPGAPKMPPNPSSPDGTPGGEALPSWKKLILPPDGSHCPPARTVLKQVIGPGPLPAMETAPGPLKLQFKSVPPAKLETEMLPWVRLKTGIGLALAAKLQSKLASMMKQVRR